MSPDDYEYLATLVRLKPGHWTPMSLAAHLHAETADVYAAMRRTGIRLDAGALYLDEPQSTPRRTPPPAPQPEPEMHKIIPTADEQYHPASGESQADAICRYLRDHPWSTIADVRAATEIIAASARVTRLIAMKRVRFRMQDDGVRRYALTTMVDAVAEKPIPDRTDAVHEADPRVGAQPAPEVPRTPEPDPRVGAPRVLCPPPPVNPYGAAMKSLYDELEELEGAYATAKDLLSAAETRAADLADRIAVVEAAIAGLGPIAREAGWKFE